jgi:DNA-binding response OmpR family regulator
MTYELTKMTISILYVEDEIETAQIVELYLQRAGFEVTSYSHGDIAKRAIINLTFDLAILDIMLPGENGLSLLKLTVAKGIPTIMVTAKSAESDKIFGLDDGADDYICKPFSPNELVSRVKALLRRTRPVPVITNHQFGDFLFDIKNKNLSLHQHEIIMTNIEFEILEVLITNSGKTYSRKELLDHISKDNLEACERTIDTHILNLRKKIEVNRRKPQWLMTVFGIGYKFNKGAKAC